jgi:putative zinc finger/helix-turn-helix YgiT family protein
MSEEKKKCPVCDSAMNQKMLKKEIEFRGVNIECSESLDVCGDCEIETADIAATGSIQRQIADKYRTLSGLLSGQEIASLRKAACLSQKELSDKMSVGVASIKRWETGGIQSKSMDDHLRHHLQPASCCSAITGNREFAISRLKLVVDYFEKTLDMAFLKKGDKLLYNAKYLWYADMLSFRSLGQSMTGATYAALPKGPQLNNYTEIVEATREADTSGEVPLTKEEKDIIESIALRFPHPKQVFDASHEEQVWKERSIGTLISYSGASRLTQI